MAIKTTTLKCDLKPETMTVTYKECKRDADDKWETLSSADFQLDTLPASIQQMCSLYGLRAILADRTSDAKKLGVNKLDWMREVYAMFESGQWNKPREAKGGVDRALVHLIVELKGCSVMEAEAALKQASKDWKDAVKDKYADDLDRIRREMSQAAAGLDLTDL